MATKERKMVPCRPSDDPNGVVWLPEVVARNYKVVEELVQKDESDESDGGGRPADPPKSKSARKVPSEIAKDETGED